jgi:hypothetical protein
LTRVLYSVLMGIGMTSTASLNPSVFLGREPALALPTPLFALLPGEGVGGGGGGGSLIFRRLGEYRSSSARSYLSASVKHETLWFRGCCQSKEEVDRDRHGAGAVRLNPWSCGGGC